MRMASTMTEDPERLAVEGASTPKPEYVPIEGWRYVGGAGSVGPHQEADSCDLPPECDCIYRRAQ